MREVISNIFYESGFKVDNELLKKNNAIYAERTSHNKFDFYVVQFTNVEELNQEELNNEISYYLNVIVQNKNYYLGLDKNLTLLIFLNCDKLKNMERVNSIIFDIEEDPYDFNKYVLPYRTDELNEFKKNVNNSGKSTIDYMQEKISDAHLFSEFKRRINSLSVREYELVTKFFIKLPFISYNVTTQNTIDLSKLIRDELAEEDKNLWTQLLNMYQQIDEDTELVAEDILMLLEVQHHE